MQALQSVRIVGPAVPLGQLDRLPGALRRLREKGPVELDLRPVHQAHELEIGPPDPARQRDPLFQVRLGLVESACPGLDVGDFDQRKRAQLVIQADPRRRRQVIRCHFPGHVRGSGQGLQLPRLLGHRWQVPMPAS